MDDPAVLAHRADWRGKGLVLLHNLGSGVATVSLKRRDLEGRSLIDWLGNRDYGPGEHSGEDLELDAYGYRWFRLSEANNSAR